MANKDIDLKKIKELIDIMKQNGLEVIEINHGEDKVYLKRSMPQPVSAPIITAMPHQMIQAPGQANAAGSSAPAAPVDDGLIPIKSPLVGTFYAKPSPDSDPFVEIGSSVGPQTVVCIVEAMKVMNEIKAETSGTIVESFVTDGQAVEYGQVLFKVKPD